MSHRLDRIAADLESLTPADFDLMNGDADGPDRVDEICTELRAQHDAELWAPLLYALMERLDGAELGSPGPIVHALEAWDGYRPLLAESLRRKPTPLTVWMANRVLNSGPPDGPEWLSLLRDVEDHPAASAETRTEARDFLEHQANRR